MTDCCPRPTTCAGCEHAAHDERCGILPWPKGEPFPGLCPCRRRWICSDCRHHHRRNDSCRVKVSAPIGRTAGRPFVMMPCGCRTGVKHDDPSRRQTIPLAVRRAVIARDGRMCSFCGVLCVKTPKTPSGRRRRLTLDHIIPWSKGGEDTVENLRVACASCNSARGNRDDPADDTTRSDLTVRSLTTDASDLIPTASDLTVRPEHKNVGTYPPAPRLEQLPGRRRSVSDTHRR